MTEPTLPASPIEASSPPAAPATTPAVAPVTPVVKPRTKGGSGWLNLLLALAAAVAVGGVAFAVGRSTAPAAAATGGGTQRGFGFGPGGSFDPNATGARGLFGGGGPTLSGTVVSVDNGTLTLKLASGTTMTVALGPSTTYHSSTTAAASDVTVGATVDVRLQGGRFTQGGGAGATSSGAPSSAAPLTARDVTVSR